MANDDNQPTQWVLRSAKKLKLKPHPGWLDEPYFPRSRLTMLDGTAGIGKGLRSAALAVEVASHGGSVIWFTAEDDPEMDVLPRLLVLGFDRDHCPGNIYFLEAEAVFPKHIEKLEEMVSKTGAELVVFDPGRSFLRNPLTGEGRWSSEEDVRPGLEALGRLCVKAEVAAIFIHHWNRSYDRAASERYGGSAAFEQVVRHRVTMAWDKQGGTGAVAVTKSNIAKRGFVRSYRVAEAVAHLPVADGTSVDVETARFEMGQPLPFAELDDWMRYVNRPITIELEPDEVLEEWLVRNVYRTNGIVPDREALREATGLSQAKVKAGLAALREQGLIAPEGKQLRWLGTTETNEDDGE